MEANDVLQVGSEAIFVLLKVGAPIMMIGLLTGLLIAFIQALTQIQEMTLAFVPKILMMFVSLIFLLPYMLSTLMTFTHSIFDRIVSL